MPSRSHSSSATLTALGQDHVRTAAAKVSAVATIGYVAFLAGPPIIGPTPLSNLYLNTGHGTLGWTMSAGSARVLADMVSGRTADIDLEGLTIERYGATAPAAVATTKGAHA